MPRSTDSLLIARIGKPHGLGGEVTVQTHTDDPERRFVPGRVFDTGDAGELVDHQNERLAPGRLDEHADPFA